MYVSSINRVRHVLGRQLFAGASTLATSTRDNFCERLPDAVKLDINEHSQRPQTGVSLKYLLDFGSRAVEQQMFASAQFLHQEIPVRLAHRIMDLSRLPPALLDQPQVQFVKELYARSFMELRALKGMQDPMDVARFTVALKGALTRHAAVVPAMAKGVEQYKRSCAAAGVEPIDLQSFLDSFFLSRIAVRFLAGQHCALFEPAPLSDRHIGLVHTACPVVQVASDAVADARAVAFRTYGSAPSVLVHGPNTLTFPYVPGHLHHMVFELVKNSLRAVQERYSMHDEEPPPISVVVAEGLEDVTIKVCDQGGGIARSGLPRIWTYLYTTAQSPLPELDDGTTVGSGRSGGGGGGGGSGSSGARSGGGGPGGPAAMPLVLAGYGCGLPLSRLYAHYFGGSLSVMSMEGYGTDAYLHLNRLASSDEPLPGQV